MPKGPQPVTRRVWKYRENGVLAAQRVANQLGVRSLLRRGGEVESIKGVLGRERLVP